nr:retrovirus-related Pol polyprotein from transposon TNT 1-94 [Tanacetum cinerariifolium]
MYPVRWEFRGAQNRPPMLKKDMYDSWKSKMELYMMNRQHRQMILESVENVPLIWPSIEENGVTRPTKYSKLSSTEAIQANWDVKATNIILQGLPIEVYALLRNSSNPRQQATINDGRITLQPVQGRQIYFASGTSRTYTSRTSGSNSGKQRPVIYYNCKREGHMSKHCTKPKRKQDDLWFKDKVLLKAQQLEPKLYDGNVIEKTSAIMIPDSEETLMLPEESRSKMFLKQKDPIMLEKKVNIKSFDYVVLNQLSQDFEKRFVPQTELFVEQAFWSQNSLNSFDPIPSNRPTIVEVPKELPKFSMVNTSLKKLKHHLAGFDVVVKKTTATAITEGAWRFEHTKACFRNEIIPFEKVLVITALKDALRKLKGKALADDAVTSHSIALEMFNVDVEESNPRLLNNRSAHSDYLKHTQEEATILREILEQGKSQNPLNAYLDYALGNAFPLTRITTTAEVPFRKPIALESDTPKPVVGISHETSVARSPQQNGAVERRNHTLIKVACTMLIYAKAPLFLWAEAVATAWYTQNRSIVHLRHDKTPYELLHDKLPDLSFFHLSGALCYPTNDSENLGKLQSKADIGIFIGYAPTKKAFRIYNRRTWQIIETIHVDFDELIAMALKHISSGSTLHEMTPATISSRLMPNPPPLTMFVPPSIIDLDMLCHDVFTCRELIFIKV